MTPKKFKESNVVYGEGQKEYLPLPARLEAGPEGIVITKWRLSFIERIRVLFTGTIWLSQMSFRKPLQPQYPTTKKTDFFPDPTLAECATRLRESLHTLKIELLKALKILPVLCAVMIFPACTDRPEISEGYIVDMEYQPAHNRTEYNTVLKHSVIRSVPARWILWVANRDGGVRIETEDSVYINAKRGQFINIKNIKK